MPSYIVLHVPNPKNNLENVVDNVNDLWHTLIVVVVVRAVIKGSTTPHKGRGRGRMNTMTKKEKHSGTCGLCGCAVLERSTGLKTKYVKCSNNCWGMEVLKQATR